MGIKKNKQNSPAIIAASLGSSKYVLRSKTVGGTFLSSMTWNEMDRATGVNGETKKVRKLEINHSGADSNAKRPHSLH